MADSRPFLPSLAATANDAILNDILQTVQLKEAHLATGRNQGAVWQNVLDLVFSHHMAPCRLYKPPKCKYGFKNVVVKAIETRYNMVTQRGAHSTGNPDEFEDVSEVNKLAILLFNEMVEEKDRAIAEKLQKEAHRAEVKAMSDAVIVPPLALPANFAQLREHYANNQKTRNPLSVLTGAAPAVSPIPGFGTATASTAVDNDDAIEIDLDGDENSPPKKVARQRLSTGDAKDLIHEFQKKTALVEQRFEVFYNNL